MDSAYFPFVLSSKVTPWPAIPHYDAESRGSLLCLWLFVGFRIVMDPASKCGMTWVFTWQCLWMLVEKAFSPLTPRLVIPHFDAESRESNVVRDKR